MTSPEMFLPPIMSSATHNTNGTVLSTLAQVWILPVIYWDLTVHETMMSVKVVPRKLEALTNGTVIVTVSEDPF